MQSQTEAHLADVWISSELKQIFDGYFFDLKRDVLERTVQRAADRRSPGAHRMVSSDDLAAAAEEVFAGAANRLNRALTQRGADHVRRAS